MSPIVNDQVTALSVCHLVNPAENSEAIEIPCAFRTRVGPGKDLYRRRRENRGAEGAERGVGCGPVVRLPGRPSAG